MRCSRSHIELSIDSVTTLCEVKEQKNIRKIKTRSKRSFWGLEELPAWAVVPCSRSPSQLSDSNLAARRGGVKPLSLLGTIKRTFLPCKISNS